VRKTTIVVLLFLIKWAILSAYGIVGHGCSNFSVICKEDPCVSLGVNDPIDYDSPIDGKYEITSSKHYSPSVWENGFISLDNNYHVTIPEIIPILVLDGVALGNAGNHSLRVDFLTNEGDISCKYRGGSSQSKPNGAYQISLGLKYHFNSCTNIDGSTLNLSFGDSVFLLIGDRIQVVVENGDSRESTVVKATFVVTGESL